MVTKLLRPRDGAEALALLRSEPGALALAGGTQLLSAEFRDRPFVAVALAGFLDTAITTAADAGLHLGAGASFQDLLDSPLVPELLRRAAAGMATRNVRNRATLGGNLGADKSCSSLIPPLLCLDARLLLLDGRSLSLGDWLALEAGSGGRPLIASIDIAAPSSLLGGYARWARVSCDLSVLSAAASYRLEGGRVRGLTLVLGGMGAHARRFPALEALFEGKALPGREAIEALVAPRLSPISDQRGSADFKRLRMAGLVSEALLEAAPLVFPAKSTEARA